MQLSRREVLQLLSAAGISASLPSISTAGERLIAWHNWSGGQSCIPAARLAPASEDELAALLKKSSDGGLRAVGSGHSFSPLVPTDGKLISLAKLSGLIGHDQDKLQAEFWAGTPMWQMGEPLKQIGQGLINMADIDYQTLAGAISTSTHGTGPKFGSYSSTVIGLRLITAAGDILDLDAQNQPELFNAARVSLGALGIITRVRLQNRKAFRLRQKQWIQSTDELLEDIDSLAKQNDHFEFVAIVHSDVALAQTQNETEDPQTLTKPGGGDGPSIGKLAAVDTWFRDQPRTQAAVLDFVARHMVSFPDVQDDSWKVLTNVRDQRFNEMEYEVPAEAGPACIREVLTTIRKQNLRCFFPVEYRYVKADGIPISMFCGRDTCAISVHQYYELDYHNFMAQIEPIFWKYEGRPHWGKLHTLNHAQFATLYPRWKEFLDIRQSLDPKGRFLNGHLREVFGVSE